MHALHFRFFFFFSLILFPVQVWAEVADIVFVGAGPVGLYAAVQAKILNPKLNIHFFEKYKEYQRTHVVKIEQHSFSNAIPDAHFRHLLESFGHSIRTTELEGKFRALAEAQGITLHFSEIKSLEEVLAQFPAVPVIVGSDGARSMVRESFVPKEELRTKDLGYTAQIKYDALTETRALSAKEKSIALPKGNHTVMEYVGRPSQDGKTPVTLQLLISKKEEFETLKAHSSFKKPILLNSKESDARTLIPEPVYQTIQSWMENRKIMTHEKTDEEHVKLTVTSLTEYYSPQVYFEKDNVQYFLVGDAAFGVPYFRSINNGFESANVLARVLAKKFDPQLKFKKVLDPRVDISATALVNTVNLLNRIHQNTPADYQKFVKKQQKRERSFAHMKNFALDIYGSSVELAQFFNHSFTSGSDADF